MNIIKDFLGQELNVGDKVVALSHKSTSSTLYLGKVERLTNAMVVIKTVDSEHDWRYSETMLVFPYKVDSDLLDDMCYEKLLVCDFCVVVTPEYIGKSTSNRIRQAISMNKPVYVWENNGLNGIIKGEKDLVKYTSHKGE